MEFSKLWTLVSLSLYLFGILSLNPINFQKKTIFWREERYFANGVGSLFSSLFIVNLKIVSNYQIWLNLIFYSTLCGLSYFDISINILCWITDIGCECHRTLTPHSRIQHESFSPPIHLTLSRVKQASVIILSSPKILSLSFLPKHFLSYWFIQ